MDVNVKLLSDVIVWQKYARFVPELGRRETWSEIVDRTKNMHIKRYPQLRDEIEIAFQFVYEKKVLPSMRSLQFAGRAIELNNLRQFNCLYVPMDDIDAFCELMFALLSGCGVGYSVQQKHVSKLPEIRKPTKIKRFLIQDSILGWADSVKALTRAYFTGKPLPVFDFNDIRPKGALLKTSGGIAPGPEPLRDCLHNIQKIFDRKNNGEKLTSLEVHDINCFIGDCVLAGGVRRAAMLSLFNLDDDLMLTAKFGHWWELNPQRARANNSATLMRHRIKKQDFFELWDKIHYSNSGEPGFFFSNEDMGTNPCISGTSQVALADGRGNKTIKELAEEGQDVPVYTLDLSGKLCVRMMRNPRVTGYNQPLYKVVIDNDHEILVTPNHKFLTSDGEYVETKDLVAGTSLHIMTKYEASIKDIFPKANSNSQNYFWLNNGQRKTVGEHKLIAEFHNNVNIESGYVVHHINYNAQDNRPENLQIMTKTEHDEFHRRDKLGDKNPMRRAKTEWSQNKWDDYKHKQSLKSTGESNKNYSGFTNEDLIKFALELTQNLARKFSLNEWIEFAKTNGLPTKFSRWRQIHLGGIVGLAKYAAQKLGYENLECDPRTLRALQKYRSQGYDCDIIDSEIVFHKICEVSGKPFDTTNREVSVNGRGAALKIRWGKNKPNILLNFKQAHKLRQEKIKHVQAILFTELKNLLGREPLKKEWQILCKERHISYEISRVSSPFKSFNELREYASFLNHRVVSVEFIGYQTVYNGTVDEFHNFFIGAFEEKTQNGKRKWVFVNNQQCGEASLKPWGACNLTEINFATVENQDDLNIRSKAAAFIGTLQAGYTDFHYLRDCWKQSIEKDALLGVSLTGLATKKVYNLDLEEAGTIVVEENARVAKLLNINKAARCTLVKPSGTASLVLGTSSGVHCWHSKYYIRRVRMNKEESLYKYLLEKVPSLIEDDYFKPKTDAILSVPIRAPKGAITRDETATDLMERIAHIYKHWILPGHRRGANTHNISATITVKETEWEIVRDWMWEHRNDYTALSILPENLGSYRQAPFEEITKEQFDELTQHVQCIDLTEIHESTDQTTRANEPACSGGACEITY